MSEEVIKQEVKVCRADDQGRECVTCGVYKAWTEYNKNKAGVRGHDGRCRECLKAWRRSDERKAASRERAAKDYADPEKRARQVERMRGYHSRPDVVERMKSEEWKKTDRERKGRWKDRGGEELRERLRVANREAQKKRAQVPRNKLSIIVSAALRKSLHGRKSRRHWEGLVGYGVDELKVHLERLFEPGMTWENHRKDGWHIDHVVPLSAFFFERPEIA